MGGFPLDVKADSIRGFRLDLKIGCDTSVRGIRTVELENETSCGMVEITVYEL